MGSSSTRDPSRVTCYATLSHPCLLIIPLYLSLAQLPRGSPLHRILLDFREPCPLSYDQAGSLTLVQKKKKFILAFWLATFETDLRSLDPVRYARGKDHQQAQTSSMGQVGPGWARTPSPKPSPTHQRAGLWALWAGGEVEASRTLELHSLSDSQLITKSFTIKF